MPTPTNQQFNKVTGSWDLSQATRIPRPGYVWKDSTTVKITASASKPRFFNIAGQIHRITSDIECSIKHSGAGGVDVAPASTPNPYYLYGIIENSAVKLIASLNDPDTPLDGPTGYSDWTYIGGISVQSTSGGTIFEFSASGGVYSADEDLELEVHTGDTSITAKTFTQMPSTIRHAFIQGTINGTDVTNAVGRISGSSTTGRQGIYIENLDATEQTMHTSWIPILTAKTLYLHTNVSGNTIVAGLKGWREEPTEWA
jgi:hypothetical protein